MINVSTDGACKGNPGPGGWGVAIFEGIELKEVYRGGSTLTTNNRMELKAMLEALSVLSNNKILEDNDVTIYIDSTYVLKGMTEWLSGWEAKRFIGVKNEDLWRDMCQYRHIWEECTLTWVKGHSGNLFNEEADKQANLGYEEL